MSDSSRDGGGLFGVWRLVSAQVRMEDTGEASDMMGTDPRGFAIIDPGGRIMTLVTPSGRPVPAIDAEAASMFRGMAAYTGGFTIEGGPLGDAGRRGLAPRVGVDGPVPGGSRWRATS